ncbi:hypothetical protein OKA05_02410 [Luteolibacter arcticus]|uniref:Uncharacterized protein n=1 Tax=Luteolibacter arcticus TaxID=1581411 RepID=A0ABT3GCM6_9BACT|nr:DUF6572 domain-containing protein [Luteolibacter arcticus]MCW1921387.1 hypothetical protein [Luteolibacter arcticus]
MGLENDRVVDAVGIENATGIVVLTIADSWDWNDVYGHLMALQAKLNTYISFVEGGQLLEEYPLAEGCPLTIDIVTKFPMDPKGAELLTMAADVCRDLEIEIRTRHVAI